MIKRIISIFIFSISVATAQEQHRFGGIIEGELDGKLISLPLLKSDIKADIEGDIAKIEITQTFANPTDSPMHARYLFPMNKDSAVYAMTMTVGDEVTVAEIKRKEEARRTFEKAKSEGRAASLLTQFRPNMFTQEIANLMPGLPIKVTIKYSQVVPKRDGDYELVVPLVVGPRYQPADAGKEPKIVDHHDRVIGELENSSRNRFGSWELEQLPDYPGVGGITLPKSIEKDRVTILVNLNSSIPINTIYSDTHELDTKGDEGSQTISLKDGSVIDNRDFVLRYKLSGSAVQAGFLSTLEAEGEGTFSILIEPPEMPLDNQISRREMVFVLDTSGSMRGEPLDASKIFMNHALQNLRAGDAFRIISFNNTASEYSAYPQDATSENIRRGLAYVDSLQGGGGTQIDKSVTQAFRVAPKIGTMRIVVFLTDGYIGNEATILSQIDDSLGDARIFAFGVGSSVNRFLLSEMGRRGRGFARFIDPTEKSSDVAISLATKLNAPVLTDISLDFGSLEVEQLTPTPIPDLFAGDSIRIQGKFKGSGTHTVRINGSVNGRRASLPIEVSLAEEGAPKREALPIIWARSMVADRMHQFNTSHWYSRVQNKNDQLKYEVTNLGLKYSLVTQWTSFVAVSKQIVNKRPDQTTTSDVPLPQVAGVDSAAYVSSQNHLEQVRQGRQFGLRSAKSNVARLAPARTSQESVAPMMVAPAPVPSIVGDADALYVAGARVKGRTALDSNAPVDITSQEYRDASLPQMADERKSPIAHMPVASTPEPGALGGLLLLSLMGLFALRRRKKTC